MKKGPLAAFGAGLILVAIAVALVLYRQRGQHLQAAGIVIKARTLELEKSRALLVLDARMVNDSDVAFTIRNLEISIETADGTTVEGVVLSPGDLKSTFSYNPLLGEQFTPALAVREMVAPRATVDRTLAATFPVSLAELEGRRGVELRVEDQTGPVAVIAGK